MAGVSAQVKMQRQTNKHRTLAVALYAYAVCASYIRSLVFPANAQTIEISTESNTINSANSSRPRFDSLRFFMGVVCVPLSDRHTFACGKSFGNAHRTLVNFAVQLRFYTINKKKISRQWRLLCISGVRYKRLSVAPLDGYSGALGILGIMALYSRVTSIFGVCFFKCHLAA